MWYEHRVISGNYRLGEFQGAVLNAQIERLAEQTATRDANGAYLASRLRAVPGIFPQRRPPECTRHAYHLFMLRLDPGRFGAPRDAVLPALEAEGIPCSAGYGYSLPAQPLFRNKAFGPYLAAVRERLDYGRSHCPNSDLICQQSVWLEHHLLLGIAKTGRLALASRKVHRTRAVVRDDRSGRARRLDRNPIWRRFAPEGWRWCR